MTLSKSDVANNTLISLHEKLTHLNSVITPEAVNRFEDKLGRIFTLAKMHHCKQGQKYGHLSSAIMSQSTGSLLETNLNTHDTR
jgi:hypothetical protein